MNKEKKNAQRRSYCFNFEEPRTKRSKVSQLLCQVIGTQEVITSRTVNYFTKLPHEVVLCIFKYLDFCDISKCALLCRSFWIASNDSSLYQKVSLKYSYHPKHIESYVSKAMYPKVIEIIYKYHDKEDPPDGLDHFNKQIIKLFKKCGENVTSLFIESCRSDEVLFLLSKLKNLKKLHMGWCKSSFETLPEIQCLIDLQLVMCDIPTYIVVELLKNNPQLKSISLTDTKNLQTSSIAIIIGNYNHELEVLSIREKKKVKAQGLQSIAKCANLRALELTGGPFYSDPEDCFSHLAAGCTRLQRLVIYGWKDVTDVHLKPVLQNCTQLKYLDLRGLNITVKSLKEAALSLPFLKFVSVYKCGRIKKAEIVKLKTEFPEIEITN